MINGFDSSHWSGNIDFNAARRAGNQFWFGRVGRGQPDTSTTAQGIDKSWRRNLALSLESGLITGGYWRFFPNAPISMYAQVENFLSQLNWQPGMLPPLVDIEDTGGLSRTALTDYALQVLSLVHRSAGIKPILYTGKNFYDNHLEAYRLTNYQLAIAWQKTGNWGDYGSVFWQYKLDTPSSWSQYNIDLQKFAYKELKYHTFNNELLYFIDSDGMYHGPNVWNAKLLPESGSSGTQSNLMAIVHTMVGYLKGTDTYFRRSDIGTESHLGIGGRYDGPELDGAVWQWMRLWEGADANLEARSYGMSIETSDGTRYQEVWSPKQDESIAQCLAAWCLYYGRPPVLVARANATNRGLAFHRQGIIPYKTAADDKWSIANGKICPGFERSDHYVKVTIPRTRAIVLSLSSGTNIPKPDPPEIDMQLDDVVGRRSDGSIYTVRNVFDKIINSISPVDKQNQIIDCVKSVRDRVGNVESVVYAINDQPDWDALTSQNHSWESLEVWASL